MYIFDNSFQQFEISCQTDIGIERILSFFMMDIGEYHADIQRNCEAISPDVRSTEGDIDRQFR